MSIAASTLFNDIQTTVGPNKNIKQKFVYVNLCVIGFCHRLVEQPQRKKVGIPHVPKATGLVFLLFLKYLLVYIKSKKTCEFVLL